MMRVDCDAREWKIRDARLAFPSARPSGRVFRPNLFRLAAVYWLPGCQSAGNAQLATSSMYRSIWVTPGPVLDGC